MMQILNLQVNIIPIEISEAWVLIIIKSKGNSTRIFEMTRLFGLENDTKL
jgi:hypothetical protein